MNKEVDFAKKYADEWAESSIHFNKNSHYRWMVEQLGCAEIVIEIGCGVGYSTHAIAKKPDRKIFVIESNKKLIDDTVDYLLCNNISLEVVQSPQDAIERINFVQVVLIHANIFEIGEQLKVLSNKFDALVCWLIGTDILNICNQLDKDFNKIENSDFGTYRQNMHAFCYELGEHILKKRGFCHMVDRVKIKSWEVKNSARNTLIEEHKRLVSQNYTIDFENTSFRKSGNFKTSQMRYVLSSTVNPNGGLDVLSSIKVVRT